MKGFLAAMLVSMPMLANAYTWTDKYDAGPAGALLPEHVVKNEVISWSHNINDNGFKAGTDHVSSYSLDLWLSDDLFDPLKLTWSGLTFEGESASVTQGGSTKTFEVNFSDLFGKSIAGTASGVASLDSTGLLSVTLKGISGDFYFFGSELTAKGTKGATSVPEPTSLGILAAGIIGIVMMRRLAAR